jgi:cytochrome c1
MTKAREGGPNYVYTYLIGYYITPEGMTSNHVFPETKMPDMMGMSGATDPAQRAEIQTKARDIVSFLAWAADPHEEERHKLGYYVIGYLLVLTTLLFFVKNQIWSRLK